jgi:hypothetical protein
MPASKFRAMASHSTSGGIPILKSYNYFLERHFVKAQNPDHPQPDSL